MADDTDLMGGRSARFTIVVPSIDLTYDKRLLRRILGQAGREVAATARSLVGRGSGGRKYGKHIASSPGQPPATLTGRLAKSIKVTARGDKVTIKDTAENAGKGKFAFYAIFLETGAHGGGGKKGSANIGRVHRRGMASTGTAQTARQMQMRPFLTTAAEGEMPRLRTRIAEALTKGVDLKVLKAQGR